MKKNLLAIFAILALVSACNKEENFSASQQVKINFTADAIPSTRTVLDPSTRQVSWSEGDKIQVLQTVDGATTVTESNPAVIIAGKANFSVSLPAAEAEEYSYTAVYPASAWWDNAGNNKPESLQMGLVTIQKPSTISFDPAADILLAQTMSVATQAADMELRFARVVAIGEMTITGLATSSNISIVKITALEQKMSNWHNINTADLAPGKFVNTCDHVILDYGAEGVSPSNFVAYFSSWPFSFEETGGTLIVEIATKDDNYYRKEISIAAGVGFKMEAGRSTIFTVDMSSGATRQQNTKFLPFNFNLNPGGWPEAKGSHVPGGVSKNFNLGGVNYEFLLETCTMNAAGTSSAIVQSLFWNPSGDARYLIINAARYLGLPVIPGYALIKIDVLHKASSNSKRAIGICSQRYQEKSEAFIDGGEKVTGLDLDKHYIFNFDPSMMDPSNQYFLACLAAGAGFSDIDLFYTSELE